jgi:NAD(P)-dependent dehydrogenase (short-subunit alcohol dehydrogenase family)
MNQIDLGGRGAVVTGGAQGIGLAVARRLLASGAKVALWDRDAKLLDETIASLGRDGAVASGEVVDVTDPAATARTAERTSRQLGAIDILVNNAGIAGMNAAVTDYPVEEWRRIIDINLNGVFNCCRAVVPGMVAKGYGRIVNVASIAGKEGNPNAAAYSASKAGVIALTKSLGTELAGHDIAVNCITPAAAKTALFAQMTQQHIDYMLAKIPRARFVEVDEIAAMVAWLASAENSFTTGAVFDISGGRATY